MGFKDKNFEQPIYAPETEEPKSVIIISCEGSNTEPEYFKAIKYKLKEYIPSILEIEIVPKDAGASEPKDVMENLQSHVSAAYDFSKGHDSLWLICDREKDDGRKSGNKGLLKVLPICEEKGISMALTNPLFEFWLLLHIVDISDYDIDVLFNNEYINPESTNKKRFIEKELFLKLSNGYNKKKGQFNKDIVSLENIKRALKQELAFENEVDKIVDNLGSNLGQLIREILPNI